MNISQQVFTKTRTTKMKNNLVQQIGKPVTSRNSITKYIKNISIMSNSTANEYYARLTIFEIFVSAEYNTTVDDIIKKIKEDLYDPYDVLSNYSAYLSRNKNISFLTLKQRVVTAKNFLEYHDVDISPRKFKLKVKLPKVIRKNKEALSKEDIVDILNACSDIRLKTYVMSLAPTGCQGRGTSFC